MSAAWLAANLEAADPAFVGKIERIEFEAVGSQTTDRSLARIIFKAGESPPALSCFIKSRSLDFATGLFGAVFDLGLTEVRFYQQIRAEVPVRTPQPRFATARSSGGDFVLVLDRLEGRDLNFKTVADSATLAEAEKVIDALAALHAHFWQDRRFATTLNWLQDSLVERWEIVARPLRKYAFEKVFREHASLFPHEVSQRRQLLETVVPAAHRHNHIRPETLLHGDPHLGNMYFQDGEVGLLDWQVVQRGCGMKDVAYFMITSLSPELRRAHQYLLLERYVEGLARHGVSGYGFDEAWHDYRINSIHSFVAIVVTAASGAMQERAVVERGLRNTSSALIDLDAIELFRGLDASA